MRQNLKKQFLIVMFIIKSKKLRAQCNKILLKKKRMSLFFFIILRWTRNALFLAYKQRELHASKILHSYTNHTTQNSKLKKKIVNKNKNQMHKKIHKNNIKHPRTFSQSVILFRVFYL